MVRAVRLGAPTIIVTDSRGAASADASAIAAGIPSRALMQRAGAAAAAEIATRFSAALHRGVVVVTGAGNNGGDGWVIAHALHAVGIRVRVVECFQSRTTDAKAERDAAIAAGVAHSDDVDSILAGGEDIAVDALVGTGLARDEPLRGRLVKGVAILHLIARRGGSVVAIDVPSGLDATDGMHVGAARCALTLTFGTIKRGQLVARGLCGDIVALDIGLGTHVSAAGSARLATAAWFRESLPEIAADAHKGTRKKIAIIGGAAGMAGAAMLAARGALRSGAGMVKCVVAAESLPAIQEGEPAALCAQWPDNDEAFAATVATWADVILIGPGLGGARARELVERTLRCFDGPVVIDADALNVFAGDAAALVPLLRGRAALLTPHPVEFARLSGQDVDHVLESRFTVPYELAAITSATVLLKGVPTVVSAPDGETIVVAEGTPILATGGAGDVLGGIAATLLAQTGNATMAGALAAFAHGRAASSVSAVQVRGFTLDDVLGVLPAMWSHEATVPRAPILAELPAIGQYA
ncbi:MAG: NAD(P)H-hydrate epimerase [Gemmatimonadetes bacterium]|nr:NAD(P)H-hydrate epimerase [Gemmatimonadota bacterium]